MDCPNISAESCLRSNLIFAFFIAFNDDNSGLSESTTSTFIFIYFPPRFAVNCYEPKDVNFSPSPNLKIFLLSFFFKFCI